MALVLGQVQTEEKSNGITAIPQLLAALDIAGCVITIDARGCQKEIAKDIVGKKGIMSCPQRPPPGNSP
jgi:predicted transposase YbfD/YdcC